MGERVLQSGGKRRDKWHLRNVTFKLKLPRMYNLTVLTLSSMGDAIFDQFFNLQRGALIVQDSRTMCVYCVTLVTFCKTISNHQQMGNGVGFNLSSGFSLSILSSSHRAYFISCNLSVSTLILFALHYSPTYFKILSLLIILAFLMKHLEYWNRRKL